MISKGIQNGAAAALELLGRNAQANASRPGSAATGLTATAAQPVDAGGIKRLAQILRAFEIAAGRAPAASGDAFRARLQQSMAQSAAFVRNLGEAFGAAPVVAVAIDGEGAELNGQALRSASQPAELAAGPDGRRALIEGTDARDTLRVANAARVGTVKGEAGNDSIDIDAAAVHRVEGGDGKDRLLVSGDTVKRVKGGRGSDHIRIAAQDVADVGGGQGDDRIAVAAYSVGSVRGGAGDDTLRVRAASVEAVDGGYGADRLDVAAVTAGHVSGGEGDDTIGVTAVAAEIAGGAGNDAIRFDVEAGRVLFGAGDGNDTIRLGRDTHLMLDFSEGLSRSALTIEQVEEKPGEMMLRFESGESILLQRVRAAGSITLRFADGEVVALRGEAPAPASAEASLDTRF